MHNSNLSTGERLRLSTRIAEQGLLPRQEVLEVLQDVAQQVQVLHAAGRVHLGIDADAVLLDQPGRAILGDPQVECRIDVAAESCLRFPLALRSMHGLVIPCDLAAAQEVLRQHRISIDARQVDLFALGAMFCWLLTGKSVDDYLRRPGVKGSVPVDLQLLIEQACGLDGGSQPCTASSFVQALRSRIAETKSFPQSDPSLSEPADASDVSGARNVPLATDASPVQQDTAPSILSGVAPPETAVGPVAPATSNRTRDELPFQRLGHYDVVARIGHGGMGDVFKGYEPGLDRTVALKVLPAELARHADFVSRFRAEATAAAKLLHPGVVQIFFIGEDAGHHYFAMQFVEGESLAQRLAAENRLSIEETLDIIEQVLSALAAAHEQGLIHRDIKPGNILLDRRKRRALLADFGLVKVLESPGAMTATGVIMGTVDYISPEQGRGRDVDGRSDLYSLGVLMYQMLSGRLPFEADSPTAMIFQHAYEPPRPLGEIAKIPFPLAAIVHRLLAKSPEERYQTADQLLGDLRAFHDGRPLSSFIRGDIPATATPAIARLATEPAGTSPSAISGRPRQTVIIPAPQFDEIPALPADETTDAPAGWWGYARDRVFDAFRAQAPELLQHLQNTGQQMDGAIREYERRRRELEALIREAEGIAAELETQLPEHGEDSGRAELEEKLADQHEQLATMRLRLTQNNVKLHQLTSQRDILLARLNAAEARAHFARGGLRRGHRRAVLAAAGFTAIVLVGFIIIAPYVWRQRGAGTWTASWTDAAKLTGRLVRSIKSAKGPGGELVYQMGTEIRSLAFQPSRSSFEHPHLASGGEDASILLETLLPSGTVSAEVIGQHTPRVHDIAFSPDGQLLAAAGGDGTVQLWTAAPKVGPLRQLAGHSGPVRAVAFSADGKHLLSGGEDATVRLWECSTGRELQTVNVGRALTSLAWSPDGNRFHVGYAQKEGAPALRCWDLTTRSIAGTVSSDGLPAPELFVPRVGSLGYSMHGPGTPLLVWNEKSCERVGTVGTDVAAAAFSASGWRVLTADSRGALTLWNTETGKALEQFAAEPSPVTSLVLSLAGDLGASAHADGTLRIRKYNGGARVRDMVFAGAPVECVAFAPDGGTALSGAADKLDLLSFDPNSASLPAESGGYDQRGRVLCLKYSADGSRIIYATGSSDSESQWVNLRIPANLLVIKRGWNAGEFQEASGHTGRITSIDSSSDGSHLATSSVDGTVRVWDVAGKKEVQTLTLGGPVCSVSFSPQDDARLLVGVEGQGVQLWDRNQKQKFRGYPGGKGLVRCASFATDGSRVIAGDYDQKIRVWDTATATLLATLSGHEGAVNSVVSIDQGRFALSGADDGTVRFWNIDRKSPVATFRGHWGSVRTVAVSPRGDTAISGSDDGTIRIWKLPNSI